MNKLSVIVPVYNGEKEIEATLHSLLCCSIPLDIIVIDDGSNDSTPLLLSQIKHPDIHVYRKENQGIAMARNYALDKIKTPYFTFLDADDTVEKDVYEKVLELMEDEKSDIAFTDFLWEYPDGQTRMAKDTLYNTKKELLCHMFATLWNKVYRTEWFMNTGLRFPEGLHYEDASLLYRLIPYMDKVSLCPMVSVHYNQRQGSITHTFNTRINDMITVFTGIDAFYKEQGLYETYKDELEYLFTRFFFGNSYLRAVRIEDKNIRQDTLRKGYAFITSLYPNFKQNPYLKQGGKKNAYYRHLSSSVYYGMVPVFRFAYRIGVLK